jgi:hypothetical protein
MFRIKAHRFLSVLYGNRITAVSFMPSFCIGCRGSVVKTDGLEHEGTESEAGTWISEMKRLDLLFLASLMPHGVNQH